MKKTLFILTIILLAAGVLLFAQNAHFTTSGTVEFNKTVNMYAQIQKEITKENEEWTQPAFDAYKKNHQQFLTAKSTLNFAGGKELFIPVKSDNPTGGFFDAPMAGQNNTVYTDFADGQSTVQKQVFEQTYLVKDTIRKIKWKITEETRVIAGYNCHRANGLVLDSVYVVAFYTDEIHVSGGPESFNGLPGMILGIALPHDNITWFATKVELIEPTTAQLTTVQKGKKVTWGQLQSELQKSFKDWGKEAEKRLWIYSL